MFIKSKEFKADKAHSINELKDLLPNYINGSVRLFFQLVRSNNRENSIRYIFNNLKIAQDWVLGKFIKSPEIYLNEMRLIKSEFEITNERGTQISAEAHELVREIISSKKMKGKFRAF